MSNINNVSNEKKIKAVVLAAGKGTRLQSEDSDIPKVMRKANAKPLLSHVLTALSFIDKTDTILVVGYKKEEVIPMYDGYVFAEQKEQLGTGHAVNAAREILCGFDGSVLVCYGDMPLIRGETYKALLDAHSKQHNDCTILSGESIIPLPYGRIIRDESGEFLEVVEDRDCTPEQKKITELNSGVYVFNSKMLLDALGNLKNDNNQGEYYLTDVPAIMLSRGAKIGLFIRELGDEIIGVNDAEQLCYVEKVISCRL